jgi:hypothetical protein
MKKFYLPKPARLCRVFLGTLELCIAVQFNATYRERVANLPTLVDQHGYVASADVAISGLDSYADAKKFRTFSIVSLGLGVLFWGVYVLSKSQKAKPELN